MAGDSSNIVWRLESSRSVRAQSTGSKPVARLKTSRMPSSPWPCPFGCCGKLSLPFSQCSGPRAQDSGGGSIVWLSVTGYVASAGESDDAKGIPRYARASAGLALWLSRECLNAASRRGRGDSSGATQQLGQSLRSVEVHITCRSHAVLLPQSQ